MRETKKFSLKEKRSRLDDELTATVKEIINKAKAAQDAKNAKLRKLRAARDVAAAVPKKKKSAKKVKR